MVSAFDEMRESDGRIRPAYKELSAWLEATKPDVLDYRRREAELIFRRIGITFAVYGEADSQERLIPFDVIPRILSARGMGHPRTRPQAAGSRRSTSSCADIYGRREILRAGIIPDDLIFRNPVFRPEMNGQKVPHDIYVHIAGIDIVRVDAETFYVLEDNARTPSGVSYMLENREIMMRLFPDLFVAPPRRAGRELSRRTARDTADRSRRDRRPASPTVVLLTPGVYNSAYYEHSFLADKLGVELVEGRDLFVKDDIVYMRTTQGPAARRRDLPPHRRRLPRSPRLPPRFRARRARPDVGLSGRQRHARQRRRHRHRRRQGGLQLHAGDREILSRRGADPEERADLALPRARTTSPMCSTIWTSWSSRRCTAPAATAC